MANVSPVHSCDALKVYLTHGGHDTIMMQMIENSDGSRESRLRVMIVPVLGKNQILLETPGPG